MIIPAENLTELEDVPPEIKKLIKIVSVSHVDEVIEKCFQP